MLSKFTSVLALILRLRQACDHPYLALSRGDTKTSLSAILATKRVPWAEAFKAFDRKKNGLIAASEIQRTSTRLEPTCLYARRAHHARLCQHPAQVSSTTLARRRCHYTSCRPRSPLSMG